MKESIVVKESALEGLGIFANRDFEAGDVVVPWRASRQLTRDEAARLPATNKKYLSRLKDGSYILLGIPERYVNHSCEPNTKVENNADIAIRVIKKGEEITADYRLEKAPGHFTCNCGSSNCIGEYSESL